MITAMDEEIGRVVAALDKWACATACTCRPPSRARKLRSTRKIELRRFAKRLGVPGKAGTQFLRSYGTAMIRRLAAIMERCLLWKASGCSFNIPWLR
jgi:hypothetical protein